MTSTKLIRLSGIFSILAGILYALSALIHPAGEDVGSIASVFWVPAHLLGSIAAIFILFGLMGLYGSQLVRTGWLGFIAFFLAFVGSAMLGIEESQSVTMAPLLAGKAPALLEQSSLAGPALIFGLIFLVSFFLGFLLLGIASMRAGVLPRWSGLLLILGLVLTLGGQMSHLVGIIAAVVFGAGLAWMGSAVWSGRMETE